jgi:hypothetical protein
MKIKLIPIFWLAAAIILILFGFLFLARQPNAQHIIAYTSVDGYEKFFIKEFPTDTLSLVDYVLFYKLLEKGEDRRIRETLNLFIDRKVIDAQGMIEALGDHDSHEVQQIEKALDYVAQHRMEYPRTNEAIVGDSVNVYQPRTIQLHADRILKGRNGGISP